LLTIPDFFRFRSRSVAGGAAIDGRDSQAQRARDRIRRVVRGRLFENPTGLSAIPVTQFLTDTELRNDTPMMLATRSMASSESLNWQAFCDEQLSDVETIQLPPRLKIPRPPRAIAEFLQVADAPDATVDLERLARVIETDPELTARLLTVVNSCGVGLAMKVYSIKQAVCLLGLRRSKMLVLSAALHAAWRDSAWYAVNGVTFQSESVQRALFARFTASALGRDPDIAYAAALIQDILLPFLLDRYPKEYAAYVPGGASLADFETATHVWSHASLGAQLLRNWTFPEEAVACVLMHHQLDRILEQSELHTTNLVAAAAAALLPDSLSQEPSGIRSLLELQHLLPEFDFLDIAAKVDDHLVQLATPAPSVPLQHRLGELAVSHVRARTTDHWLGRTVGSYQIVARVGEGAMGSVYRAQHTILKRPAAVKLLKAASVNPGQLRRFEIEAEITSQLENPHTTMVFDYGETIHAIPYYVMEYLEGISLFQLVGQFGPQPEGRVIHILRQVCESLAEAHAKGLIHRDIKPENIILCNRGGVGDFVKVVDFGLATFVAAAPTPENWNGKVCGTPHYMAPETIAHPDTIDARTDLYSLGGVAYWLLTGSVLFASNDVGDVLQRQLCEPPVPPSQRRGHAVSPDLERLILATLSKDPADRPTSVLRFAELLSECGEADGWGPGQARHWWSNFGPHSAPVDDGNAGALQPTVVAATDACHVGTTGFAAV
jgi:serine/threonine-protein kinase